MRIEMKSRVAEGTEKADEHLPTVATLLALLFAMSSWAAESMHTVPYVPSASSEGHAGLVRIESRSEMSGEVRVAAVDDAGRRVDAGALTLGSRSAVEFDASALESGDASLGLAGTGPGEGDWRLELSTELDIKARAYARAEGFVTALHDSVLVSDEVDLSFFNPGSEMDRRSVLRLANAGGAPARVTVLGVDDGGSSGGSVTVELGAWEARTYTATELEGGSAAGLTGSLGDGEGRWRLTLSARSGSAYATNLLRDGTGVVSSVPGGMSRGSLHRVSLFPSASDGEGRRGLVRVVNRAAETAQLGIEAFDETDRAHERLELTLGVGASGQFDSSDLEQGAAEKGLAGSAGPGEGDWWLELSSGTEIEVLSYVDTASGPLSALRGTSGSETAGGMRYEALLRGGTGELRLLNAGGEAVEVLLSGVDDAGSSGGEAELTLEPWAVRTLTASQLAEGGEDIRGALGAGTGSWRVTLDADGEIDVLSLVRGTGGMLSDVSRRGRPAGSPPPTEVVDATKLARPDLWVSASASDSDLSPNEAFDLTATVGNRGGRGASATTLRYYRSDDPAISASDAELGTDPVSALGASQSVSMSVSVVAPASVGTYYYGACVDAAPEETQRSNNCSRGVRVAVFEGALDSPDLVVSAWTDNANPEPEESFMLSATVRNRGSGGASATTLRYYRSDDSAISASDAQLGTDPVSELGASQSVSMSVSVVAPASLGTYYYGACVDAALEETQRSNNCSRGVRVAVLQGAMNFPDLVVSASTDKATPEPEELFTLSATVRNRGSGGASATTLRYYSSSNATITTTDLPSGTDPVGALAASGTSVQSIMLTARLSEGPYFFGACVDAVEGELDTSNNCSSAILVTTERVPPPDLKVSVSAVYEYYWVGVEGQVTTLSATVTNDGKASTATALLFYLTRYDTRFTPGATVATVEVPPLDRYGMFSHQQEVPVPETPGEYSQRACVDTVPGEVRTLNNCNSIRTFEVAVPQPIGDLDVTIPLGCPLEVDICVQDNACEDGDRVRISVNGSALFTTDLFADRWVCETVAVNEGQNLLEAYIVNGTGYKGRCSHANSNTGAVEVRAGNVASTSWRLPAEYLTSASLNVTVGGAGPCPGDD